MFDRPFRRRTLLRGAAVLAASLSPGCGADDDALTFFFQANPEEADARLRIIAEFGRRTMGNNRNPGINVRTVLSGPDPMQQMSTFCAGGKCPDILMAWELTYAGLADRGVLLDLNTLLQRDRSFAESLKADSIASLYETFSLNGGQYALPEQWSGNFLFYNTRLFADAGVPPPPAHWQRPWTFAQFRDAAEALTKRDRSGNVAQWGFVDTWVPPYSAGLFGMNNGVAWCTPRINPTRFNFDDDAFLQGIQFYADLACRYHVAPTAIDAQSISTMDLFSAGRAAMAMGGHWRYQTFARAEGLEFDVTVLPVGPHASQGRSDIGTTGLAIAASSPRKDQAWEFVKFAAGPAGQALIGGSGLFVPVLNSALRSAGFVDAHRQIRNLDVLTDGPANSGYLPVTPDWARINALIDRHVGPVLRGARPAASLSTGLTREINQVLTKR